MEALDVEQTNIWARSIMSRGNSFDWVLKNRDKRVLTRNARTRVFKQFAADVQPYIEWINLINWEDAIRLAVDTDSFAPDCIHVAAALSHSCDVLVTSDDGLRRTAANEIAVATPQQALSWIRSQPLRSA